jgi:hypothetical protein
VGKDLKNNGPVMVDFCCRIGIVPVTALGQGLNRAKRLNALDRESEAFELLFLFPAKITKKPYSEAVEGSNTSEPDTNASLRPFFFILVSLHLCSALSGARQGLISNRSTPPCSISLWRIQARSRAVSFSHTFLTRESVCA